MTAFDPDQIRVCSMKAKESLKRLEIFKPNEFEPALIGVCLGKDFNGGILPFEAWFFPLLTLASVYVFLFLSATDIASRYDLN